MAYHTSVCVHVCIQSSDPRRASGLQVPDRPSSPLQLQWVQVSQLVIDPLNTLSSFITSLYKCQVPAKYHANCMTVYSHFPFACSKQLDHRCKEREGELYCLRCYDNMVSAICGACRFVYLLYPYHWGYIPNIAHPQETYRRPSYPCSQQDLASWGIGIRFCMTLENVLHMAQKVHKTLLQQKISSYNYKSYSQPTVFKICSEWILSLSLGSISCVLTARSRLKVADTTRRRAWLTARGTTRLYVFTISVLLSDQSRVFDSHCRAR